MGRPRTRVQQEPTQQGLAAAVQPQTTKAPEQLTRQSNRRPTREQNREAGREVGGRGAIVEGRNGEQLTRRRQQVGDEFQIEPSDIPDGWSYQWNAVTTLGKENIAEQNMHHANGWRPVPAERHPGRWMKLGATGEIVVAGLRLEERPARLTKEALDEGIHNARQQVRDQTEALSLSKKMPKGYETGGQYRGTGADVRMQIDRSMDIAPGDYQTEE